MKVAYAHVRVNGIRQHYLRVGQGPRMVVVPGITSPAVTWQFVAEHLAPRFEVFVMDVRGRGLSSAEPDLDYGLNACAQDVVAFATELGLERPILLGHSMGARIAARAASLAPQAFGRIVLADPPLSGPGRRPYVKTLPFYLASIQQAVEGRLDAAAVKRSYPSWTEEQCMTRAQWLHTCSPIAIAATHRSFHDDDIHPDLAGLRIPSLMIVAGRGDVIRPEELAEVRGLCPTMAIAHLPEASHMIPFDNLEGFAATVIAFAGA